MISPPIHPPINWDERCQWGMIGRAMELMGLKVKRGHSGKEMQDETEVQSL
jgi:hypothetical protein